MYEVKSDGDVFRIYNTKTKKMLKPVYKKRETAVKNVEKKNCVSDINDKYVKEKPKKKEKKEKPKKAKEFEVIKAKTFGTAVVEDVPIKAKKKPKSKSKQGENKPRKYKMSKDVAGVVSKFTDPSSTSKDKWKKLIEKVDDVDENLRYFKAFQDLIEMGNNDFKGSVPLVDKIVNATDPKLYEIPASIINKISKIILKNKTETEKIVKSVVDKISNTSYVEWRDDGGQDDLYDRIGYNNFEARGYFELERKDDHSGFTSSFTRYRNVNQSIKELREDTKREKKEFMEMLVDYFKTKADAIRTKATIQNI